MEHLFVFHGVDHKCGTTMIAQSVAELIARSEPDGDVLLISLNSRKSTEFVRENVEPIDYFKSQLDSGIPLTKNLLSKNKKGDNLYIIAGLEQELEERYYLPGTAEKILGDLGGQFRVVIADTGSSLDNGLAIGGLSMAHRRFLILTQNEAGIRRYEQVQNLYKQAQIAFDSFIVNKFCAKDPYTLGYISDRLQIAKEKLQKVEQVSYGRQAEMEYRSLLDFGQDKYSQDICTVANQVAADCALPEIRLKRRNPWKSFI